MVPQKIYYAHTCQWRNGHIRATARFVENTNICSQNKPDAKRNAIAWIKNDFKNGFVWCINTKHYCIMRALEEIVVCGCCLSVLFTRMGRTAETSPQCDI